MLHLTTFRLYLLGIALLFVGYVALEYNRPKPLNWAHTYINKDKIPHGTFVLYDQLPHLLGTDSIETVRLPVYNQLTGSDEPAAIDASADSATVAQGETTASKSAFDTVAAEPSSRADTSALPPTAEWVSLAPIREGKANYLFISPDFRVNTSDARALLAFAALGNDVFIATENFSDHFPFLRDTLGYSTIQTEPPTHKGPAGFPVVDSVDLRFTNPALQHAHIRLPGSGATERFVVDSGRVGLTLATDAQGRAVFIQLNYGRGHFYLCSAPLAFTNYYLLRPRSAAFAAAALAYLPARRTWWDEYQKQGRAGEQSLLRVVFAHDALRQAYYLTLVGALLLVLVAARRRQRIIPTIKALPNTTLLFTRTVASLYRQGSNHALIAEKKVGLFLDYLRTRFQETSPDFGNADFRERLSQKSGVPRPRVDELLRLVNFARTAPQMNDQQLLQLSRALSDFRREARR
ncbi:hypothetical protein Q3A66_06740 [Hymenobacter sp. BT770]|uniref:DUF4350 domain-containing protein n=1 Tax=Hymenobacter sp. BT770 TaxID=2886942 RepID=UPI001D12ABC1|nr:DUF4350 domain-containing protein [Hymenobacter sp. BT770]MCC3152688.1 hypothetical protein [Hymenobacter sp. BT770]MDO3414761.1 hypothetical protein [Hymenobacter sp. BT770]